MIDLATILLIWFGSLPTCYVAADNGAMIHYSIFRPPGQPVILQISAPLGSRPHGAYYCRADDGSPEMAGRF